MTFPRLLFLHPVCTAPGPGPARRGSPDPCGVGRGLRGGCQGFKEHWNDFCLPKNVIQAVSMLYLIPKASQSRASGYSAGQRGRILLEVPWSLLPWRYRWGRLTRVCVCAHTAPGTGRRPAPVPHTQSCRACDKCSAREEVTLSCGRWKSCPGDLGAPGTSSLGAAQSPCAVRCGIVKKACGVVLCGRECASPDNLVL